MSLNNDNSKLTKRVTELELETDQKSSKISILETSSEQLTSQISDIILNLKKAGTEINLSRMRIEDLESQLYHAEDRNHYLNDEIKKQKSQIDRYFNKLSFMETDNKNLELSLENKDESYQRFKIQKEDRIAELEAE